MNIMIIQKLSKKGGKTTFPIVAFEQIIIAMKKNSISKTNNPHENKGPSKREHMCTHKKFEK
jgi:hypothetical protein